MKLNRMLVEKPWGKVNGKPFFDGDGERRIGEVWFDSDPPQSLLAKFLFTSERLSVQVHPSREHMAANAGEGAKTECWVILDAEEGATIALGFREHLTKSQVEKAALDGSIVDLLDWRPVRRGDVFLVPPGTVHAIGAGITLFEFQQNHGLTYRIFDYGRPRDLHLAEALSVATLEPFDDSLWRHVSLDRSQLLLTCQEFSLILATQEDEASRGKKRWLIPLEGSISLGSDEIIPGEALLTQDARCFDGENAWVLLGLEGELPRPNNVA